MATLILGKTVVRSMLDMAEVIKAVEQAFRDWTAGKAAMPAKSYVRVEKGDFRAMPAALPGSAGLKWVNVHPENPAQGLPTVMAVLILNDPATGYPLAVMDATDITAYRTGATAAIASKYMARRNAHTLGIIGAGRQAYTQAEAHAQLFDLKAVKIYDMVPANADKTAGVLSRYKASAASLEEAAGCDIVCTVTPTREPVIKKEYIYPGTHINAIGADAAGKEELEPALLKGAVVVVDDLKQASGSGEINVPLARGLFSVSEIYATLGEIISGKKPGRPNAKAVTIFDSTGVAIEDVAVARLIYDKAMLGNYPAVDLV
jgi:alanine dehydrogenase